MERLRIAWAALVGGDIGPIWAFIRGATTKPSIPVDPLVKVYSADGSEVFVRESRIATSSSGSLDA